MPNKTDITKQQLNLACAVGHFMKYWGFKSIHGRIWCLVYLSKKPRDAQYFIDHLNVSKALISLAIKDLIKFKVICRIEIDPPSIFQHFIANPKILEVILDVLKERELKMLENVKNLVEVLEKNDTESFESLEIDPTRLNQLKEMTSLAYFTLNDVFEDDFETRIGLDKINK